MRTGLAGGALMGTALVAAAADGAEPLRGTDGGSILGPRNKPLETENPFTLVPPKTDHATLPDLKWSFAVSHMRLEEGGWARQTTVRELPVSDTMAGVNIRLNKGAVRERHWHKASEWAYMLAGTARVTAIDQNGRTFIDDVGTGDLWFFPSGIPHSIQGLEPDGCEFLLVFDDGSFSEDNTFLVTDWLAHTPREVIAKSLKIPEATLNDLPDKKRYIFNAPLPSAKALDADMPPGPAGRMPTRLSHRMLVQEPIATPWRSVRITDTRDFSGLDHHGGGAGRGQSRRHAGAALAPECRRMAVLHRRAGPDDGVRLGRRGPYLRLSGRRCRLRALRAGPLHREHRHGAAAFPGDVPVGP